MTIDDSCSRLANSEMHRTTCWKCLLRPPLQGQQQDSVMQRLGKVPRIHQLRWMAEMLMEHGILKEKKLIIRVDVVFCDIDKAKRQLWRVCVFSEIV